MLEAVLDMVVLVQAGASLCSGAWIDPAALGVEPRPAGLVVTAYHCVASGSGAAVHTRDGGRLRARVVARSPGDDLALLAVDEAPAGTVPLAPALPAIGDRVYALGHPFGFAGEGRYAGLLRWSASEGIVGAVGEVFVQTDAAVNPGGSGGPLVDAEGRMVGVVSRKLRADNLGFATRADRVADLVESPRDPPLGGSVGAGVGLVAGEATHLGANAWIEARGRGVLRGWAAVAPGQDQPALWALTAGVRQGLGHGRWAGAVELGGGVVAAGPAGPLGELRLSAGPLGLSGWWRPQADNLVGAPAVVLDLALPGRLGVW